MAPEIRLTAQWVAAAMAGRDRRRATRRREFGGVSIDTRTLRAGRAVRRDSRRAVRRRRLRGRRRSTRAPAGVVVPRRRAAQHRRRGAAERGASSRSTTRRAALQALAQRGAARRRARGSWRSPAAPGKTTTKEVTAEFLAARYRVIRNRGNLNNHIGLPLSLIELTAAAGDRGRRTGHESRRRNQHAGAHRRAGRARLDERRRGAPRVLRVGRRHRRREGRDPRGRDARRRVLVANADDDRIVGAAAAFRRPRRDVRDRPRRPTSARRRSSIAASTGIERARDDAARRASSSTTPLVGRGNLANVLAATAVALEFGVPLDGDRRARARGCGRRRIAARSCGWRAASRSSTTATTRTRRRRGARSTCCATRRTARAARRGARRDARARRPARSALHEEVGRAAAAARRRPAGRRRRRAGGGAGGRRPSRPGMPRERVQPRRDERRGGRRRGGARRGRAISCW